MKNRVYFFSKLNNLIMHFLPFALPIIIVMMFFHNFDFIKDKITEVLGKDFPELKLGLILIVAETIIGLLLQAIKKIKKKLVGFGDAIIKHKLYSRLRATIINLKHKMSRFIGNKSINSFYHANCAATPEQIMIYQHFSSLLLNENKEKKVMWIQGESFSGKTNAIAKILINIISEKNLYNAFKVFYNKIIYIDLFTDDFKKFINKYNKSYFEKAILIIDNTYVLSEYDINYLVNTISTSVKAEIIIVCMRDFHETISDPFKIQKLSEKMNLIGQCFSMPKIIESSFNSEKDSNNRDYLFFSSINLSTQVHYKNMLEKNNKTKSQIFIDITDYLDRQISPENLTHKIIFIISCFSMFSGCFTKKQLKTFLSKRRERFLLNFILSELHSCGFVDRSPYGFGDTYIFNSEVAKDYFKSGYVSRCFEKIVFDILNQQYKYYKNVNIQLAFLYGCLLKNNYKKQIELFNSIAINTNFKILLNEMKFLESVDVDVTTHYKKEFGVLCDRAGEINQSRQMFKSLLIDAEKQNNTTVALDSFYRLVQMDHTEYEKYIYLENCDTASLYLQIQKKYWKLHIDMHKGIFRLSDFISLLEDATELCNYKSYDELHLIRRIYFDVYRLYYLDGSNNANKLLELKEKGINIYNHLKHNLDEFSLYYRKFTFLFLLSKEILYNYILDESIVDAKIYEEFIKDEEISYADMSNGEILLDFCIKTCQQLEDSFEKIGDKTFNFIRYYRTELLIIKNDPSCKSLIKQYRDFGTDEIEYCWYADFLDLKYLISQFLSVENISNPDENKYETLKSKVKEQFDVLKGYFISSYKNDYAIMRYKVYELLFAILERDSSAPHILDEALELAENNSYNREVKLLNIIKDKKCSGDFGWYRNILLYYPIVPQ